MDDHVPVSSIVIIRLRFYRGFMVTPYTNAKCHCTAAAFISVNYHHFLMSDTKDRFDVSRAKNQWISFFF